MSGPVAIADLAAWVEKAFVRAGLSPADATLAAEPLVLSDSMGVFTHGTKLLPGYLKKLRACGSKPDARPRIVRQGPGWAIVDGDASLGQIGCRFALDVAIDKAKSVGVAYVGLRNTGHIGAAGAQAVRAARQGLFALVCGNDAPSVAAAGSRGPVLGSNPLAWAAPLPGGDPILLDIATAAVAGGKVYAAMQRGEPIPAGWLVDQQGLPTSDGSLYPQRASLAPMAGHKGFGIGILTEWLAAILPGGAVTAQVGSWMFGPPGDPTLHNAGFVVIDVATVADPEEYRQSINRFAAEVRGAAPATGTDRVRLPGDIEWEHYRRSVAAGIHLPADVRGKLAEAAGIVDLEPVF
ncbi:MAG: Ldh family oxidoreductase [Planctomycetota bacterium]|nr:MAG: Ldh family oxidoreductase [Planctomycetota bacterium]